MKCAKDIIKEISDLNCYLEKLRENCDHKETIIRFSEEKKSVMVYCKDCCSDIRYANNEELKKNGFI
jgi:hypothetical protein